MTYKKTRQSYNSIDFFKFIMAICVVAIHTQPIAVNTDSVLFSIYNIILTMAVPFFFLSSGFLIGIKLETSSKPQHCIEVIGKQCIKVIKMYLIWSAIYLPLAIYGYYIDGKSVLYAIVHYIRGLVFLGKNYNSWQLWYLLSTIYTLVVILLLLRSGVSKKYLPIISVAAAVIVICVDELVSYSGALPGVLQLLQKIVSLTVVNGKIFKGLIYIPLGIFLAQKPISLKVGLIFFVMGFISDYFVKNSSVSGVLLIVTSVAFFVIALNIKLKDRAIYPTLRNLSTKVYLIHMYVWSICCFVIYGEKTFGLAMFVITIIVSLIICCIWLLVEKKAKCIHGNKSPSGNTEKN